MVQKRGPDTTGGGISMSARKIVIPFHAGLISSFNRQALVVRTCNPDEVIPLAQAVNERNKLHAVWLPWADSLGIIPLPETWGEIPVALYIRDPGTFRDYVPVVASLRKLNIKIFLSSDSLHFATDAKILSSLGISCGIYFGNNPIDWEQLTDLLYYSVYTKTDHAPIEPFQLAVSQYDPKQYAAFNQVYFDNPRVYLHVDENFNVALTAAELSSGVFVGQGLQTLEQIEDNEAYTRSQERYQDHLLKRDPCSFCPGFRMCAGLFSCQYESNPGCKAFFTDLLDACEFTGNTMKKPERGTWPL
jgi:hypothetical protein